MSASHPPPSATVAFATVPASRFVTKNSSQNCFLNDPHPLRVQIPLSYLIKRIIPTPQGYRYLLGGESGIRTLGEFPHTAFRVLHLRPLGQLSLLNFNYHILSKKFFLVNCNSIYLLIIFFKICKKTVGF